ncbi:hypothetical protein BGZ47_002248 [Haplosporangium gracile]|nr:hypothetical protein BGZ47_002248 [Haplosporangium gracile]
MRRLKAQYSVGVLYGKSRGVPQNYTHAVVWYLKAAGHGYAEVQFKVSHLYSSGRSVSEDDSEAVNWYIKAANQGHVNAQCIIDALYENDRVAESLQEEEDKDRSDKETVDCQNYTHNSDSPRSRPPQVASNSAPVEEDFAKTSIRANPEDMHAQIALEDMYMDGQGVETDYQAAMECYHRVANKGDATGQRRVGYLYRQGLGVRVDYSMAMDWFFKSVEQGNADS